MLYHFIPLSLYSVYLLTQPLVQTKKNLKPLKTLSFAAFPSCTFKKTCRKSHNSENFISFFINMQNTGGAVSVKKM